MKFLLFAIGLSLIVPWFAFTNAGITGDQNKTTAPLAPCMWLYAEHDNVTSNDIISIRVTNVATCSHL